MADSSLEGMTFEELMNDSYSSCPSPPHVVSNKADADYKSQDFVDTDDDRESCSTSTKKSSTA